MRFFIITVFIIVFIFCNCNSFAQVSVSYDATQDPVSHAIHKLRNALAKNGASIYTLPKDHQEDIPTISVIAKGDVHPKLAAYIKEKDFDSIKPEGYAFRWINDGNQLLILTVDAIGGQYGIMELAEAFRLNGSFKSIQDKVVNPFMEYRIIKFNLPWSPYRNNEATTIHNHVVRDLHFWEKFLDMMVENRLNALSLWNNHPFPFMIKATNFPEATPFDDREMDEWRKFWKALFSMAKQRGIETYIVNWNIVVSPEFAEAYNGKEYNDLSDQVKKYTRESVTQLINEYEDLTGLGVTLADWMGTFNESMTPQQREDWIEETFIAGIKAAKREVKFIHRSVLAGDPIAMRNLIDRADLKEPVLVEIKFNWSHSYSTPTLAITHDYHSGQLDERFWTPMPENYNIQWMMRNEDFFILRWAQPDFIRKHIEVNNKEYVNGYFIGSEGYIPAMDYSHKETPEKTWQYAFEKQWLFYKMWGRILFQPDVSDSLFSSAFDLRYGRGVGVPILSAYKLASKMPLRLASFHRSTWDYTLYSEGFISAAPSSKSSYDDTSPFISIDQFIDHETLEPTMISIPEFVAHTIQKKKISVEEITPLALADSSEIDSRKALQLVSSLRSRVNAYSGALVSELDDIATWSYLGLYFSDKLRAGVALEKFRKTGKASEKQSAIQHLEKCLEHWDQVIAYTSERYKPTPHVATENWGDKFTVFSWELLRPQVLRDIEIARNSTYEKE